jgi:hypothetical protein
MVKTPSPRTNKACTGCMHTGDNNTSTTASTTTTADSLTKTTTTIPITITITTNHINIPEISTDAVTTATTELITIINSSLLSTSTKRGTHTIATTTPSTGIYTAPEATPTTKIYHITSRLQTPTEPLNRQYRPPLEYAHTMDMQLVLLPREQTDKNEM